MVETSDIAIAAAALTRADGATLLVRKRGTAAFMQPGGKIDAGEAPVAALRRELLEELGLAIDVQDAHYWGRFRAPAANEVGRAVVAELFFVVAEDVVAAQAEIDDTRWVDPAAPLDGVELAPLTRDHVLPLLRAKGAAQRPR